MRRIVCVAVAAFMCFRAASQDASVLRAALYLSGASSIEEVDQEWIDRLEGMSKIRINGNHLRPGILTDYQIASLADYRAAQGDILSWEELMLVFMPVRWLPISIRIQSSSQTRSP